MSDILKRILLLIYKHLHVSRKIKISLNSIYAQEMLKVAISIKATSTGSEFYERQAHQPHLNFRRQRKQN